MTTESSLRKLTNEEIEAVSGGVTAPLNGEGRKDQIGGTTNPEFAEGNTDISEGHPHFKHP
jgi:hypothetical protein